MFNQTDAVSAAGPHHKVLFENDRVRVLETIIRPGEQTALHTHVWSGTLLILSWSDFWRFDADGNVIFQSADMVVTPKAGDVIWTGPLPLHSFRNVGTQNVHVITTELKS